VKIKEHYQSDTDIAEADDWLLRRAKVIEGDMGLVTWKDRLIASVTASADRRAKKTKKREEEE
jgi:hypothetical protein